MTQVIVAPSLTDVLVGFQQLKHAIQEQGKQFSVRIDQVGSQVETLTRQVVNSERSLTELNRNLTEIRSDSRLTLLLTLLAIIVALAAYIGEVRRRFLDKLKELDKDLEQFKDFPEDLQTWNVIRQERGEPQEDPKKWSELQQKCNVLRNKRDKFKLNASLLLFADAPLVIAGLLVCVPTLTGLYALPPAWVGSMTSIFLLVAALFMAFLHSMEWVESVKVLCRLREKLGEFFYEKFVGKITRKKNSA
jgi:hypothetical protein